MGTDSLSSSTGSFNFVQKCSLDLSSGWAGIQAASFMIGPEDVLGEQDLVQIAG